MRQKERSQNRRSACNIPLAVISSILFILSIPVEYLITSWTPLEKPQPLLVTTHSC
jgi:hypothetical protein